MTVWATEETQQAQRSASSSSARMEVDPTTRSLAASFTCAADQGQQSECGHHHHHRHQQHQKKQRRQLWQRGRACCWPRLSSSLPSSPIRSRAAASRPAAAVASPLSQWSSSSLVTDPCTKWASSPSPAFVIGKEDDKDHDVEDGQEEKEEVATFIEDASNDSDSEAAMGVAMSLTGMRLSSVSSSSTSPSSLMSLLETEDNRAEKETRRRRRRDGHSDGRRKSAAVVELMASKVRQMERAIEEFNQALAVTALQPYFGEIGLRLQELSYDSQQRLTEIATFYCWLVPHAESLS